MVLFRSAIAALVFFQSFPIVAQQVLVVDREEVRIRADATVQSIRLAVARQGQELEEIRRHKEWIQVRLPDSRVGWVHSELVKERWIVEGQGVRVRSGPTSDQVAVTMVYNGQEVSRIGNQGNWLRIELVDGQSGWVDKRFLRPKTRSDVNRLVPSDDPIANETADSLLADDRTIEISGEVLRASSVEEQQAANVKPGDAELKTERTVIRRNPYAAGLQYEAAGDHAAALGQFEAVLATTPDHVRALFHAAQAHRNLGQYEESLTKLYRALHKSGGRKDLFLTLGEVYRLKGQPDSARKYQALFRDEEWPDGKTSSTKTAHVEGDLNDDGFAKIVTSKDALANIKGASENTIEKIFRVDVNESSTFPWLLAMAAACGVVAFIGIAIWIYIHYSRPPSRNTREKTSKRKFERTMEAENENVLEGRATSGEIAELEQQIEDKWREISDSAQSMTSLSGANPAVGVEDGHLDHIVDHLEVLRKALDVQEDRARIYADLVRLQNMKIEAMTEEVQLLRRRRKPPTDS